MANKRTVVSVEEPSNMAATDGSQAVLAYRVGQLEKVQADGFSRLEAKLDDMSGVYATHAALIDAKRESELEHEKINEKIDTKAGEALREARRANRVISRVGWFVMYAVLASILALLGLTVSGVHH